MNVKLPHPTDCYDIRKLERFIFDIYQYTEGDYPALEWVHSKPSIYDFTGFSDNYYHFLQDRLDNEFDELYIWEGDDKEIIATVALVYELKNKSIPWARELQKMDNAGLIEFLMVSPKLQKQGIGSFIVNFAVTKCEDNGKIPFTVTSTKFAAYSFFLKRGFRPFINNNSFIILKKEIE